jgi:hypothetical protein
MWTSFSKEDDDDVNDGVKKRDGSRDERFFSLQHLFIPFLEKKPVATSASRQYH